MNPAELVNPYLKYRVQFDNVLSPAECRTVIEQSQSALAEHRHQLEDRGIQGNPTRLILQENYGWLIDKLGPYLFQANQQYYQFRLAFMSVPHLCEYWGEYQHMADWHMDITNEVETTVRKLTACVFLSEPGSFEGGRFLLDPDHIIQQEQGSMLIFPAFMRHKVEPVTTGHRYSLITWACGPAFV